MIYTELNQFIATLLPLEMSFFILAISLIADFIFRDADIFWRYVPHPVIWFGYQIDLAIKWGNQRHLNGRKRRCLGSILMVLGVIISGLIGAIFAIPDGVFGAVLETSIVIIMLAGHSLDRHARAVATPLRDGNLVTARKALSCIVGRVTTHLEPDEISGAAIESVAESICDGILAPAFWYLVGGLPGLFIYKFTNTADSMIGYKNSRYFAFGTAAARFDDLLNFIPARLSFLLIYISCLPKILNQNWKDMITDARTHRSPNAGWPEAAMARGLNIRLGGPRYYHGRLAKLPIINKKAPSQPTAKHILMSLILLRHVILLLAFLNFITGIMLSL